MQRYQDSVLQAPLSTPIVGASVQVNIFGGGAATIYSDNGITVAPNPTLTDANGRFAFYASDGRYTLVISKSGFTTQTISDVLLQDFEAKTPQALDSIAALKALAAPATSVTYLVRGFTAAGDGGGGFYWWNAADNTADNGGTVIQLNAGGVGRFNKLVLA